jgi:hypothetical protein
LVVCVWEYDVDIVKKEMHGILRPNPSALVSRGFVLGSQRVDLSSLGWIFPALLIHLTTDDDVFAIPVLLGPLIDITLNDTARSDGSQYRLSENHNTV